MTSTPVPPIETAPSSLDEDIDNYNEVMDFSLKNPRFSRSMLENWTRLRMQIADRHPPYRILPPVFKPDEGDEPYVDKPLIVWGIPFSDDQLYTWAKRKGIYTSSEPLRNVVPLLRQLVADLRSKARVLLTWSTPVSLHYAHIIVLNDNFQLDWAPSGNRLEENTACVIMEELQMLERSRWWWDDKNNLERNWPTVRNVDYYVGVPDDDQYDYTYGIKDEDEDIADNDDDGDDAHSNETMHETARDDQEEQADLLT